MGGRGRLLPPVGGWGRLLPPVGGWGRLLPPLLGGMAGVTAGSLGAGFNRLVLTMSVWSPIWRLKYWSLQAMTE